VIRLALRVPRAQAEIVLAALLELAPAGVEEAQLDGGETIEYAVYGAPGELPALPDLTAAVGDALVEITTSELADDWNVRWKEFHRPVLIAAPPGAPATLPSLRIRPPWEPAALEQPSVREIVIVPGQAFGTGGHASRCSTSAPARASLRSPPPSSATGRCSASTTSSRAFLRPPRTRPSTASASSPGALICDTTSCPGASALRGPPGPC
jgi:ribosomal protein L11 methylase PrmA